MRTSLVMRILRLAVFGLLIAATAVAFVTMNALVDRYHAHQAQEASREFAQKLLREQLAQL